MEKDSGFKPAQDVVDFKSVFSFYFSLVRTWEPRAVELYTEMFPHLGF